MTTLDDEHDEQPLRQKLEETELPVECLHSEWALNTPRAAAVDSNRFLRVLPLSLLPSTRTSQASSLQWVHQAGEADSQERCEMFERAAAFNQQSGTWKGLPRESSCPRWSAQATPDRT